MPRAIFQEVMKAKDKQIYICGPRPRTRNQKIMSKARNQKQNQSQMAKWKGVTPSGNIQSKSVEVSRPFPGYEWRWQAKTFKKGNRKTFTWWVGVLPGRYKCVVYYNNLVDSTWLTVKTDPRIFLMKIRQKAKNKLQKFEGLNENQGYLCVVKMQKNTSNRWRIKAFGRIVLRKFEKLSKPLNTVG